MERARLYVSISPDLAAEREAIGRAVASLPVDVGWEVSYTPSAGDPQAVEPRSAAHAHVYILALGEDIRAPMGVEWSLVRRAGRTPLAFLKEVTRTPAAQEFMKTAALEWTGYRAAAELAARVQLAMAQAILDRAGQYQLSTPEWNTLQEWVKTLRDKQSGEAEDARSGAGQGGVIFAPSREAGRGGVLLGDGGRQTADGG